MKTLVVLTLLSACWNSSFAQIKAVVAIGASTTYGMSATPSDSSWVRRLQRDLKAFLPFDSVYNLGVPGKDCYYAMPDDFIPPENRPSPGTSNNVSAALELLEYLENPSQGVIIVSYASNNYEKYSVQEILFCLQTIYNKTVSAGHLCLISTTQPRHDKYFNSGEAKRKLAIIKDSIINRFGDSSLDFYRGFFNPADSSILGVYAAGDNVHYNNAGHRELFYRVRDKLYTITANESFLKPPHFYPNPVEHRLLFDRNRFSAHTAIVVYDRLGRVVCDATVNDEHIDFTNLPTGLYVVKWSNQSKAMIQRVLKR